MWRVTESSRGPCRGPPEQRPEKAAQFRAKHVRRSRWAQAEGPAVVLGEVVRPACAGDLNFQRPDPVLGRPAGHLTNLRGARHVFPAGAHQACAT